MRNRLAYFAPVEPGGLADYAVCQARSIRETGYELVFFGYPFIRSRVEKISSSIRFVELNFPDQTGGRLKRTCSRILSLRKNVSTLIGVVDETQTEAVLISAFSEYFSPFWARRLRELTKKSVTIGVVVHDPVRDFVFGPKWWHLFSISQAYSFVDIAFVHQAGVIDLGWPGRNDLTSVVIPHGPYEFPFPEYSIPPSQLRIEFNIPIDAKVVLSFGHIRDGKNLDLVIRALATLPNVHLIIAGTEQSSGQRNARWYQNLADEVGVSGQCHWHVRFIEDEDVYKFFTVADLVVLLYSADFKSASGVLNASAQFGLPVLASSGEGPLKSVVNNYGLGKWINPGDWPQIPVALRSLLNSPSSPDWNKYLLESSWERNAKTVLKHLGNSRKIK